ncbi:MAG: phospholipid methyltransferase [Myxococcaceae bacterium]|nr:phospholipid methyltransferase [Myxococcaceae bacterium]
MTPSPTLSLGRVLFKFRSITPLPVVALLLWLLWRSRGAAGPGGPLVDELLEVTGAGLCVLGESLRLYVTGWVPDGTSGQNDRLEAVVLNTRGPYAFVRNPLYLGNLALVLGLLLVAHDPLVYALGLGFFFGEYFFIIRAEEDFLRGRFAHAFDDYCAKVPRWIPRRSPAFPGALRAGSFDWRRALKKEHNPTMAWITGLVALLAWESWARHGVQPATLGVLATLELGALMAFLGIKSWKHGWRT